MHDNPNNVCVFPTPIIPYIVVPFILYKGDNKYNCLGRVRNCQWPSQFWPIESINIYRLFTKPYGVYVISKLLKITAQSPLYIKRDKIKICLPEVVCIFWMKTLNEMKTSSLRLVGINAVVYHLISNFTLTHNLVASYMNANQAQQYCKVGLGAACS